MEPVDLFRRDGVTAYSHDVQVDDAGVAWVSGDGGTRGYWTDGRHYDPLERRESQGARRWSRSRTRAAACRARRDRRRRTAASSTTRSGRSAATRRARRPLHAASYLLVTEEDFGPAKEGCSKQGQFSIASLKGSYNGEAWRSTRDEHVPAAGRRDVEPVPDRRARGPTAGPYPPLADFCSAHYFDVDGSLVSLRVVRRGHALPGHLGPGEPAPDRLLAARRHDRLGLLHPQRLHLHRRPHPRRRHPAADAGRERRARVQEREVHAPPPSAKQRKFLAGLSSQFVSETATSGLCILPAY